MAASPLKTSEESIERKMENVSNTQDSVQSLSLWIIHHKSHYKRIVDVWFKVLKKSNTKHRLTLFNLCNDVVQNGKRKKAPVYLEGFKDVLKDAIYHARDNNIKNNVARILKIWNERNIFSSDFIKELQDVLASTSPAPVTTTTTSYTPTVTPVTATAATTTAKPYTKIPFDPKVLAEFKPQTLIDKINNFKRMEGEVELKKKQLSNLKLDASSIEAVKQLKDRSHGKQFSKQFEDSCFKLEDYVTNMDREISERKALIDLMEKSEMFYDEQYREAKIVANAYKNFGTRINNLRKKLEDLKSSLPSPIPSPTMDAPSPGNTPPQLRPDNNEAVDMELDEEEHQQSASIVSAAPVPIKPMEEYNPSAPSTTATSSTTNSKHKDEPNAFESRIATMMPALTHDPRHMDVYNPPPVVYNPPPKHRALRAIQTENGNDQGEGTPVKDEGSSTPVMDEKPEDSPPRSKNQNPIDFLTQILSKTTKSSSQGSTFLENLTLLTSTVKSQFQQQKDGEMPPQSDTSAPSTGIPGPAPVPTRPGPISSPSQQPTPPNSWAEWKAQRAPAPVPPSPPVNPPQHVLPQQPPPAPVQSALQPPMSHPPMSQPPAMPILSQPLTMPPALIMSHNPRMTGPPPPIPASQSVPAVGGPPQPVMHPPNAAMISPPINGPPVPPQQSPRPQLPYNPVSVPPPSPQPQQHMPPLSAQQGMPIRSSGWMSQPPPQPPPQPQNQTFQQPPRFLGPTPQASFPRPGDQGSPPWHQVQPVQLQANSQQADTQVSSSSSSPLHSPPLNVLPTPPKGILRNRKSSLREVPLTPEPGENIVGGGDAHEHVDGTHFGIQPPRPPSQPPSPTEAKVPKLLKQNSDSSSGSVVPDDHKEFLEKLKRKTAGNSNLVAPPSVDPQDDESKSIALFSKHPARSNLTTITPVDFEESKETVDALPTQEEEVEEKDSEQSNLEAEDNSSSAIGVISTTNSVRNKVDGHDPDDIRHLAPPGRHGDSYHDRFYNSHQDRGHYDRYPSPMPRSRDYYDPYRDPYYGRDRYRGPPPPKRPYHDPYRRPPYYRY